MTHSKIICITGQTATGKTNLALRLAAHHDCALINVDSRQIYKKLDIITGKDIPPDTPFKVVHETANMEIGYHIWHGKQIWLYDIIDPKYPFSAFDYAQCARIAIDAILQEGKTPILVGGTYFYLKNLLYGQIQTYVEPNLDLRSRLESLSTSEISQLYAQSAPDAYHALNNSEKHNRHRLMRKLELLEGQRHDAPPQPSLAETYTVRMIGLRYDSTDNLRQAIEKRVHARISHGAVAEVQTLLDSGYDAADPGLQTIGYVQIIEHLQGKLSLGEAIEHWILKEVQYAKRQNTFMKADPAIRWYSPLDTDHII